MVAPSLLLPVSLLLVAAAFCLGVTSRPDHSTTTHSHDNNPHNPFPHDPPTPLPQKIALVN
jgi:hypothetical protein